MRGMNGRAASRYIACVLIAFGFASTVPTNLLAEEAADDQYVVYAVGDVAIDHLPSGSPSRYFYDRVADMIYGADADAFLGLGDMQHNDGYLTDYLTYYDPYFHKLMDRTYPTTGNHDYAQSAVAEGYFGYFGNPDHCDQSDLVLSNTDPQGNPLGFYSFDLGSWHIVALNSYLAHQCNFTEDGLPEVGSGAWLQYEWLMADLAGLDESVCKGVIALMHHPLYDWELYYRCNWIDYYDLDPQRHLWEVLYDNGVDMVLSGHNHNYQRWAPMDPYGNYDSEGVRQFVVGTGGSYLWQFPSENPLSCTGDYPFGISTDTMANLEFGEDGYWGALRLTLSEDSYTYEFVTIDGEVLDEGVVACH